MRLINADALRKEIEFHPTSVSVCMTVAEAKGQTKFKNRCLDDIDNAPTIDAIPVEWLESKRKEALHEGMRPDEVDAVEMVLWMWNKEQEAR